MEFLLKFNYRNFSVPRESFTCWNTKLGARNTNYGTRIDYILCDTALAGRLGECSILSEMMGSDHCPVRATFSVYCQPALRAPSLCTRFFPEFVGTQQKMHAFLQPVKPVVLPVAPLIGNNKPNKKRQPGIQDFFGVPKRRAVEPLDLKTQIAKPCSVGGDGGSEGSGDSWEVWPSASEGKKVETVSAWKSMLRGPPPAPMCDGHGEKCVLRTVKKTGPNLNRQFFCCARSEGHKSNPAARCNFFQWVPK